MELSILSLDLPRKGNACPKGEEWKTWDDPDRDERDEDYYYFLDYADPSDWPSFYMERTYDPRYTDCDACLEACGEYKCKICQDNYCESCAEDHKKEVVYEHLGLLRDSDCEIEDCIICRFEKHARHDNAWDIKVGIQRCVFCKRQRNLDRQALRESAQRKAVAAQKHQKEQRIARLVEEIALHVEGKSVAENALANLAKLASNTIN